MLSSNLQKKSKTFTQNKVSSQNFDQYLKWKGVTESSTSTSLRQQGQLFLQVLNYQGTHKSQDPEFNNSVSFNVDGDGPTET